MMITNPLPFIPGLKEAAQCNHSKNSTVIIPVIHYWAKTGFFPSQGLSFIYRKRILLYQII